MTDTEADKKLECDNEIERDEELASSQGETGSCSHKPNVSKGVVLGIKQGIEFCGKHPFATGLFALIGVFGLFVSIYGFVLDRGEANETERQITELDEKVRNLDTNISELDPDSRDSAINTPIRIDFGNGGDAIDTVIFDQSELSTYPESVDHETKSKIEDLKIKDMNRIYAELDSVSSTPFFNFSVSSVADKNFVQIAPYVLVEVIEVKQPKMQLAAYNLVERGGAGVLREFFGALVPVEGLQVAPLMQDFTSQRIDFITLEPGEVEEFHLSLRYFPDYWFEFRIGLQLKFSGKTITVWADRTHRRGSVNGSLPVITWSDNAPRVQALPDGEDASPQSLSEDYRDYIQRYRANRVFNVEEAGLTLVTFP